MRNFFVLILLLLSSYSYPQNTNDSTGSRISVADAKKMLAHHNMARLEVGVAALTWNKQIAAYAQRWADHLAKSNTFEHRESAGENGNVYGENIFTGSNGYTPIDASYDWYEEKKSYKYGKFGGNDLEEAGHYTQMVWRNTKQIGVGVAVSANGSIYVVANYFPAGNYEGELPY